MGSCTAYQLAKRGKKVLLLEQFELGHSKGSSHGASRIIRYAHTDPIYLPLAKAAYEEWDELARLSGDKLYHVCGLLWLSNPEATAVRAKVLHDYGVPHSVLTGTEVGKKFPHLRFDDSWHALYDPQAGYSHADRCVKAAQSQTLAFGGTIHDNEPVIHINPGPDHVDVLTAKTRYTAKKLIVTAGAWIPRLLTDLSVKLQPELIGLTFWKVKSNPQRFLPANNSPTLILTDKCDDFYVIPEVDYIGAIKCGVHFGIPINPNNKETTEVPQWVEDISADILKEHMPDIDSVEPMKKVRCLYTMTEDQNYVLDKHPIHRNIIIGGGFSGSGFKFGAIVGKILTKLALDEPTGFDLSPFSVTRKIEKVPSANARL
uniref:Sarcosine oxidasee (formaldehyde-forming) n=1 Tax=Panagrellus redivivus TaxID=6233 RepID=A0A7E4VPZ8_PANRE